MSHVTYAWWPKVTRMVGMAVVVGAVAAFLTVCGPGSARTSVSVEAVQREAAVDRARDLARREVPETLSVSARGVESTILVVSSERVCESPDVFRRMLLRHAFAPIFRVGFLAAVCEGEGPRRSRLAIFPDRAAITATLKRPRDEAPSLRVDDTPSVPDVDRSQAE